MKEHGNQSKKVIKLRSSKFYFYKEDVFLSLQAYLVSFRPLILFTT